MSFRVLKLEKDINHRSTSEKKEHEGSLSNFSKHGLVVSGHNQMFMAGGEYPDGSASKSVWRFDPLINVWQEMASMQTPRSELGLALLDGHIYAIGGWEGSSRLDSVERYEIDSNTWSPIANMKLVRVSPLPLPSSLTFINCLLVY